MGEMRHGTRLPFPRKRREASCLWTVLRPPAEPRRLVTAFAYSGDSGGHRIRLPRVGTTPDTKGFTKLAGEQMHGTEDPNP